MAQDQTDSSQTPQSQGGSREGDSKEKLFFGKYKTIEDAEVAHKEAEKKMHDATSEAARWKEIAENQSQQRQEYIAPAPVTEGPSTQAMAELNQLYTDPIGYKRKLVQEAKQEITQEQRQRESLASRINAWGSQNRDLDQYQDLLQVEVAKTDGRLSVESRLDEAAKRVRNRLAELRGSRSQDRQPNPGDYVPGPGGSREADDGDRSYVNSQPVSNDPEGELKKMASQRNASRIKRPGAHGRPTA